jgi:hypothetical protein
VSESNVKKLTAVSTHGDTRTRVVEVMLKLNKGGPKVQFFLQMEKQGLSSAEN